MRAIPGGSGHKDLHVFSFAILRLEWKGSIFKKILFILKTTHLLLSAGSEANFSPCYRGAWEEQAQNVRTGLEVGY